MRLVLPQGESKPYSAPVQALRSTDIMKINSQLGKRKRHINSMTGTDEEVTRDTTFNDEMIMIPREDPDKRLRTEIYNNMMNMQMAAIMEQMRDQ